MIRPKNLKMSAFPFACLALIFVIFTYDFDCDDLDHDDFDDYGDEWIRQWNGLDNGKIIMTVKIMMTKILQQRWVYDDDKLGCCWQIMMTNIMMIGKIKHANNGNSTDHINVVNIGALSWRWAHFDYDDRTHLMS